MASILGVDSSSLRSLAAQLGVMSAQDVDLALELLRKRYPHVPWHLLIAAGETATAQGGLIDTGGQIISGGSGVGGNIATIVQVDASGRVKIVPRLTSFAGVHAPAVNTLATLSAAAVATVRNVCVAIAGTVAGTAASGIRSLILRDGLTAVGTPLWQGFLISAANAADRIAVTFPEPIVGTAGNAMTLEFDAAGGANVFEVVSLAGFTLGANEGF